MVQLPSFLKAQDCCLKVAWSLAVEAALLVRDSLVEAAVAEETLEEDIRVDRDLLIPAEVECSVVEEALSPLVEVDVRLANEVALELILYQEANLPEGAPAEHLDAPQLLDVVGMPDGLPRPADNKPPVAALAVEEVQLPPLQHSSSEAAEVAGYLVVQAHS